jgi:hypothetical protein
MNIVEWKDFPESFDGKSPGFVLFVAMLAAFALSTLVTIGLVPCLQAIKFVAILIFLLALTLKVLISFAQYLGEKIALLQKTVGKDPEVAAGELRDLDFNVISEGWRINRVQFKLPWWFWLEDVPLELSAGTLLRMEEIHSLTTHGVPIPFNRIEYLEKGYEEIGRILVSRGRFHRRKALRIISALVHSDIPDISDKLFPKS